MSKRIFFCVLAALFFIPVTYAQLPVAEPAVPALKIISPWKGSNIGLGVTLNTGNTQLTDIATIAKIVYLKNRWNTTTDLKFNFAKGGSGEVLKRHYYAQTELRYLLDERSFLYGRLNATFDTFSPFDYVEVDSLGYGRDLIKDDGFLLSVQIGPGSLHSRITATRETRNQLVLDTAENIVWDIKKDVNFTQYMDFDYGERLERIRAGVALATALMEHLDIKLSLTGEFNSVLPAESVARHKTDTTTTVALVYNL